MLWSFDHSEKVRMQYLLPGNREILGENRVSWFHRPEQPGGNSGSSG